MAEEGLRSRLLKGGSALLARRAAGIAVSLVGMLLLTRLIGAYQYGLYATVTGLSIYIADLCMSGIGPYLVRKEGELDPRLYRLAFTWILSASAVAIAVAFLLYPFLGDWLRQPELRLPLLVALFSLPLNAYSIPATAMLERELYYRPIAYTEMYAQLLYYGTALSLAYAGFGLWAPVIGNLAQSLTIALLCARYSRLRVSLYWNTAMFRGMIKYGAANTLSLRIMGLRSLVGPLIVGRFAGPEAVACLALANRLLDTLSFINATLERMTFAVLARIQTDRERVERAMNESLLLQVLSLAPFMIGFAVLGPRLVPLVFGPGWEPVLDVFPFMAVECLVAAIFSAHVNILYVTGANGKVIGFNVLHVLLLAGTACVCVPLWGLYGYGAAELAVILSYVAIHLPVRKLYRIRHGAALLCASACVPALFFASVPLPWSLLLFVPIAVLAVSPLTRRQWLHVRTHVLKAR